MSNDNVIPLRGKTNANLALALAQGWSSRLSNVINSRNSMSGEPAVEIDFTDEGDWSLTIESGSHIYQIHPTDQTYRRFTIMRQTWTDVEILMKDVSLEEALGRCA